jgi:hypothetical protein
MLRRFLGDFLGIFRVISLSRLGTLLIYGLLRILCFPIVWFAKTNQRIILWAVFDLNLREA